MPPRTGAVEGTIGFGAEVRARIEREREGERQKERFEWIERLLKV